MRFSIPPPPSPKQIAYAKALSQKSGRPLPQHWETDRRICGAFIQEMKFVGSNRHPAFEAEIDKLPIWAQNWCSASKYVDADIIRILSGGPLKNGNYPLDVPSPQI
jgi:hypothetical protein